MGGDGGGEPGVPGAELGLLWELRGRCEQRGGPESGGFGQDGWLLFIKLFSSLA